MISNLSLIEQTELARREQKIRSCLVTAFEIGAELAAIRDGRLYRGQFETFDDYCATTWDMSARQARRLIFAAEVSRALYEAGQAMPTSESQVRPLSVLPKERWLATWAEAFRTSAYGRVTAKHLQSVIDAASSGPAPAPVIELRPARPDPQQTLQAATAAAIAGASVLVKIIGTPDSAAAADVAGALETLRRYEDHLRFLSQAHQSRTADRVDLEFTEKFKTAAAG